MRSLHFTLAAFLCAIVAMAGTSLAQSPHSTITGTVTDAQQARIPGVEVTAVQIETNQKFSTVASEEGVYAIPSLPIGRYEVTASLPGFKTFRRSGIVLEVGQRLRLDIQLQIGEVNTTTVVTGSVSRVQTEDSSLGTTVERERIEDLPLNGRHVFNLVKLVPGVQPRFNDRDGFAEVDNQGFSQMSFNGGPIYSNQVFLDGGTNTVPVHNEISVVPMVDAVEEFKVHTNALPAEFGQTSGGVINVVTRGGTNEFHGSLYEFLRNDALDARNAFVTQRDPITGRTKPVLRYNQYGGTAGGPVWIPWLYKGKDRTFFYVGMEQWNFRTANINRATVPTAAERGGDFSNTRDGQGNLIVIYDPDTTLRNPSGSGFVRTPFPGNLIQSNRFDPLSLRVLEYMPRPNVAPNNPFTNANNYLSLQPFPIDQFQLTTRIDHKLGEQDALFGRFTGTKNTRKNRAWGLRTPDADTDARDDQRNNYNLIIAETHTFSPHVINELRLNGTRQFLDFQHPSFDKDWPRQLGFPPILPQDAFPPVSISGMLSIGSGRGGFAGGHRKQHVVQAADSVTIISGRHVIKVGTDQRWSRLNFVNRLNPSGNFNFDGGLTNNPQRPAGSGFGMATFLLGHVSGGSQAVRPFFSFHSWSNGSYIQDDFKINRRLTLNVGLRYDLESGPVERWNRSSNFDPFEINAETALPGVLLYAGATKDRHFTKPPRNNFGPRIGFAYDLTGDGKTVLRGGYGLIYSGLQSGDTTGDTANSLGFSVNTTFSPPGGAPVKAFQFNEGPATLLQPQGAAGGPSAFRGQDVRFQPFESAAPYVQQWNLTVQRELPGQWVVATTYAGNRGVHLFGANYNLNQLDPKHYSLRLSLQDQVANPFFGLIKSGPLSARTVRRDQLLRPFPDYPNVTTLGEHGASSTYHAFQMTVERRFSAGLAALLSFTGSKLIDDSFSSNDGGGGSGDFRIGRLNRRLDRGIDVADVSRRLVVSALYELPVGRGRRWLGAGGWISGLVGNWQLNSILTLQNGIPLAVRGANNFTGIGWPDLVGEPSLPSDERSPARWFNTAAFRNPADFTVGNVPRTLPHTRGPAYKDLSLSLFKVVPVHEELKLEIRGEAFNAFNWVNYNNPSTSFQPNAAGVNTNPNFGRILSSLPARRIQLGLRITF